MKSVVRILADVVGALLILIGAVWALQGMSVLNYGFMAGHRRYILIGAVVGIVGIVLIILANRRKKALGTST
jgi:hypothetical protein